jgi:pyruvate formate lyase activating enzyme
MRSLKEAMFYTSDDKYVYCSLCPHFCTLKEGQRGICGVRQNIKGKLFTLNYGRITTYNFDPIEKKPLYHFYPGSTIFSIGSYGCNLGCDFCQNWQIVTDHDVFTEVSIEDMIDLGKARESIGIAYTYNEPTVFYEFVYDTAIKARESGLKNILVTNGFINPEPLKKLLPYIDAMNIDLKAMTEGYYKEICKGRLDPVLKSISQAREHTHVEVTTLVIDGKNSSVEEMDELSGFLAGIDPEIVLHLSRYHPSYKMTDPPTSIHTLQGLRDVARRNLKYVYIGNIPGIDNDTRCPECNNIMIRRYPRVEVTGVLDGCCSRCGYRAPIEF